MYRTDDPVKDQILYDMEQRERCLRCCVDEGSEYCEHCSDMEEEYDTV